MEQSKKKEIFLTKEEAEILQKKTGYSIYTINSILRGQRRSIPRHKQMIEMYQKLKEIREANKESYEKAIKEIVEEEWN